MQKLSLILPILILTQAIIAKAEFSWIDTKGTHIDLLYGDQKIARYVYEQMKPEERERTYKPFFHLYDKKGENSSPKVQEKVHASPRYLLRIFKMCCS